MKIKLTKGNTANNHFDKPIISDLNQLDVYIDIDESPLIDTCFVILRNLLAYKNEKKMFNDTISLVSENQVIMSQKCDSTAGLNPVSSWSKRTQDAYTLKAGIYPIEFAHYKNNTNAYKIIKGETIGGYRIGVDFSLGHWIHKIGWYDDTNEMAYDVVSQWIDDEGYRSGSGGCITIPRNRDGSLSILDYDYSEDLKKPTQMLIFEYE